MTVLLVLALVGVGFVLTLRRGDKPGELNADVWDPDPKVRAANLRAKMAAWKAGQKWVSPAALERAEGAKGVALAQEGLPAGLRAVEPEQPARRLMRPTPMHARRWE